MMDIVMVRNAVRMGSGVVARNIISYFLFFVILSGYGVVNPLVSSFFPFITPYILV